MLDRKFLVDIGTFDSLVPRGRLEEIGLKPRGTREYVLANGDKVARDIATAELELEGEDRTVASAYSVRRRAEMGPEMVNAGDAKLV